VSSSKVTIKAYHRSTAPISLFAVPARPVGHSGSVARSEEVAVTAEKPPPVWRILLGYVRPCRKALLAGALLSLTTGATGLAFSSFPAANAGASRSPARCCGIRGCYCSTK